MRLKQESPAALPDPDLRVQVVVEVPAGSFVKRGASGRVEFVSPFPCPFNYGSVRFFSGMDQDPLDAAVLGPRLARGACVTTAVRGAVGFVDRGIPDEKLICGSGPLGPHRRRAVLGFFRFYALCKRLRNIILRRPGTVACLGWVDPAAVLRRASSAGSAE